MRMVYSYKFHDVEIQYFMGFLQGVSATLPRRELLLDSKMLTASHRQQLTAQFSAVPTTIQSIDESTGVVHADGITFISQFTPPRGATASPTERETPTPPQQKVSPVVRDKPVASAQTTSQGASNFLTIVGVLGKYIAGGSSRQVRDLLATADAPFNAKQVATLKSLAKRYEDDEQENVGQAAKVVLNLQ